MAVEVALEGGHRDAGEDAVGRPARAHTWAIPSPMVLGAEDSMIPMNGIVI